MSSSSVWPPETSRATNGGASSGSSTAGAKRWPSRWFTPISRRSRAYASAFAYTTPTRSAPTRPGPCVTATASTALHATPAWARARSTTAGSAARWARLASSGTTPPNTWWMSCERMIRLASSGAPCRPPPPPTSTAAEVSSHDVSMPSRTSATAGLLAQGHGIGDGAGDDPRRGDDGEPGVGAGRREPGRQGDDDLEAVAGEALHDGVGTAHDDGHAGGRHHEAGERTRAALDRDARERTLVDDAQIPRDGHFLGRDADDAERRGVDRDAAGERTGDVGDLGGDGRDRLDRGEGAVRPDDARHARRDGKAALHLVTRFRDDPHQRHDAHVLAGDGIEPDREVPRRDLGHLHVGALGDVDVARLEAHAPHRRREGVGDAQVDRPQRAQPQHFAAAAAGQHPPAGRLLGRGAP